VDLIVIDILIYYSADTPYKIHESQYPTNDNYFTVKKQLQI